jgi:hypothetical protein
MFDQSSINILLFASILILFILFFTHDCSKSESMGAVSPSGDTCNEAVKNISSVYNGDTMVVNNLQVKKLLTVDGDAKVSGNSNLGTINIRNNRIGIPGRSDMSIDPDKWIRLYEYGGNDYTNTGGYASRNLWCCAGNIYTDSATINTSGTLANGSILTDNMAIGYSIQ